ncbi:probable RNA helicase armi isoform X2 [Contarinia nasturtii]|uniref:probable RNA helicase armi isoform X2 n=1 Tax=Contarinia nasturtii TaxID=265458 RepID=UPI0012D405AB|nr:probable RNA helicase armi isoform X2 [Contarinia nasturtii]
MPKACNIEATDDLTVNFDESRTKQYFKIILSNKAGREKEYLFVAEYPMNDATSGKIRFSFLDNTDLTRTVTFDRNRSANNGNDIEAKTDEIPQATCSDDIVDVRKSYAVDVSDNLSIEFDRTLFDKSIEVVVRNNTWHNLELISTIITPNSKLRRVESDENICIEPRGEIALHFEASFVPNKMHSLVKVRFIFVMLHNSVERRFVIDRQIGIIYCRKKRIISKYDYDIPVELETLIFNERTKNAAEVLGKLDSWVPDVQRNYAEHFHTLLFLDEIHLKKEIWEKYNKYRAQFGDKEYRREDGIDIRTPYEKGIYDLSVYELFETRPSLQVGDKLTARKHSDLKIAYEGVIIELKKDDLLLVQFNDDFVQTFDFGDYYVQFFFSRLTYVRQHFAIDLAVELFGIDYLMPKEINLRGNPLINKRMLKEDKQQGSAKQRKRIRETTEHYWFNQNLNSDQKIAVLRVLRGDLLLPYIIVGPPGTGKTTALLEIVLQIFHLKKDSRILIVTQSNSAADLIATRLIQANSFTTSDLLRLISFKYSTRNKGIPEEIGEFGCTIDALEPEAVRKSLKLIKIKQFRIVISTSNTIAHLLEQYELRNFFTHTIIDEAGQCTEVDVLIPMALVGNGGQTIMAGDPMQMAPLVICKHANERGLAISMLSRLRDCYDNFVINDGQEERYGSQLVSELLKNYRTLPSILDYCNKQFYESRLISMLTKKNYPRYYNLLEHLDSIFPGYERRGKYGIHFINVANGRDEKKKTSWYNIEEVKAVTALVEKIMNMGMDHADIGIITPYAMQTRALENKLETDYPEIRVGTVEDFQGIERKVVIISTVRTCSNKANIDVSRRLGFIKCPKRINVACSRASVMVIVVGKAALLEHDTNWKELIDGCKQHKTFRNVEDIYFKKID